MTKNSFHLSIEVTDLKLSKSFYCQLLGGKLEKANDNWCNINLFGHQITLHQAKSEPHEEFGNFHWGTNISKFDFDDIFRSLRQANIKFLKEPFLTDGRYKMVFYDPSGYKLEFKSYENSSGNF